MKKASSKQTTLSTVFQSAFVRLTSIRLKLSVRLPKPFRACFNTISNTLKRKSVTFLRNTLEIKVKYVLTDDFFQVAPLMTINHRHRHRATTEPPSPTTRRPVARHDPPRHPITSGRPPPALFTMRPIFCHRPIPPSSTRTTCGRRVRSGSRTTW